MVSIFLKAYEKTSASDFAPLVMWQRDLIIILPRPLICTFPPTAPSFWFRKRQRCTISNAMVKVWAKHANCSVFGCTDERRTLFRDPASEETREQWIYWFIYCMLLPHRSKIIMRFISQLFTFTYITDCFCNSCVFNVNLWVNENIVYSHAVTAAFCPCASDVCTQKTVYQKFKLIWFKNTWFQRDKHDNQNQNRCF